MRTLWVGFWLGVLTGWHASRILWASWRRSKRFADVCDDAPRRWAQGLLRAASVRVEMEGEENLVDDSPQILVSNHVSWFDILALAVAVRRRYCFVGKKELASVPVFGPAWVACGNIAIDREDRASAVESLDRARERMCREAPILIMFPEGTRSPDGHLQRFKKGAFILAIQSGVPVVPVGILGSREVMAKHSWKIRRGTIRVRVGQPIDTKGVSLEERDRLVEEAREAVRRLVETAGGEPTAQVTHPDPR